MKMLCLGLLMTLLGGIPEHEQLADGTKRYIVRREQVERLTAQDRQLAKLCAARHGIRYRIAGY